MTTATLHTLTDRFTWLFDGLSKVIGVDAHRCRMEAALAWAVWNRVRVLGERLVALAERVQAGRMPARRPPEPRTPHPDPATRGETKKRPPALAGVTGKLPNGFGWVTRMLPQTTQFAGALAYMLRDPQTAVLVEKAPQAARMLRPLCHMLGVKTPAFLRRARAEDDRAVQPAAHAAEVSHAADGALAANAAPQPVHPPAPAAPPTPPPAPAVPWHQRPGGLYWDGRRLQWS